MSDQTDTYLGRTAVYFFCVTVGRMKNNLPIINLLHLALSGTSCVYAAMAYLHQQFTAPIAMVCLSMILGIYVLNVFTDTNEDFVNNMKNGTVIVCQKYVYPLGTGCLMSGILYLVVADKLTIYHIVLVTIGVVYSFRLIPWLDSNRNVVCIRLKQIPFIKNLLVALLWGVSIFIIPVLFTGEKFVWSQSVLLLIVSQIIATLSNSVFSDIRDIAGDRFAGNKTIPVLFGESFSYSTIFVLNFCWLIVITCLLFVKNMHISHYLFLLVNLSYAPICIILYRNMKIPETVIDLVCDSDLLVYAFGLKILSSF